MNKDRLTKIKSKLKEHTPDIITGVFFASMVTTYAVYLKKLTEKDERFPKGGVTALALNKEGFDKMAEGGVPYWIINDHEINIAYDPDC